MASNSKFDLSSISPDKTAYPSGQRGAYSASSSLDRSGSFHEGMDNNRILSALPSMSRSGSSVAQVDVMKNFQSLHFDTKLMAVDHRFPRQFELKRILVAATAGDDSSSLSSSKLTALEDLKRAKVILQESFVRARDRGRNLHEAMLKLGKIFPSALVRKRTRADASSSDRSNASVPVLGGNTTKLGHHGHAISNAIDMEPHKFEEKTKSGIPNKRVRTSMVDANALSVPSGVMDRDREMVRVANSGAVQSEEKDRALSIGMDGWERSKMKKKRSGIKSDVSSSTMSTRPLEGDRESKRAMQQRHGTDARSRMNIAHGFRPGPSGVGKADVISQQNGLGMRFSTPRTDQDNGSVLSDRRDRPVGSDKECVNLKAVNRPNSREDAFSLASTTSTTKINASARAPRSSSSIVPKSSPSANRAGPSDDWELSQCTNKVQPIAGTNNRKRMPSIRSSSPPMAQWAGQRPQKISRMARRTNFVPPMLSQDEAPASDTVSHVAGNENGSGLPRRLSSNALQQVKLKSDHFSSAALSESEESGAAEIKSKDKGKKSGDIDEKGGQSIQKVATLVLPLRKNKMSTDEDLGDGVRRPGRSGRGFTTTRSGMPTTVQKINNVITAKQLRSARLGLDKGESKAGRPPSRKLSDRKAYTRPRHAASSVTPDFLGEPDDGHEELLSAAKAAINPAHACSGLFWRQIEPLFGFVSAEDIAYLKQQICLVDESVENIQLICGSGPVLEGNFGLTSSAPMVDAVCRDSCNTVLVETGLNDCDGNVEISSKTKPVDLFSENLVPGSRFNYVVPLSQTLIAAIISVDECEDYLSEGDEDMKFDICKTGFDLDSGLKSNSLNHLRVGQAASNGYRTIPCQRLIDGMEHYELENDDLVTDINTGANLNFGCSLNGFQPDQAVVTKMACTEFQYDKMSLEERVLLEIQSIGIFPEQVPDLAQREDEEISGEISRLKEKLCEQVLKKRSLLCKLEKSITEARESQEREININALDKLVGMAYEKYMTYYGPNTSGGKSANSKLAKHNTLAFVERTLERCHRFEDTGESCFNEPVFRDLFLSVSSRLNDAECMDTATLTEGESANPCADTPTHSSEVKVSASIGSQQTASITSFLGKSLDTQEKHSSDAVQLVNHLSEPTNGKEETWFNRVKRKELLLDDVGGTVGTLRNPSGFGSSLVSGTKGKRSERDREGKGHSRDVLSRNSNAKIGRPALGNVKGERKSKTKPKQKTTQLSASVNSLLGKVSELPKAVLPPVPKPHKVASDSNINEKDVLNLEMLNDPEAIDLSNLPLPGMDVLGVPDDLDAQGQDLGSWLNIDDDGLQDHDFVGLGIPMDDLSFLT
ncbi:PREDICTED: uncharacterized protein LOC104600644 isoform X2 [Nelumbo nucifera]|uniref:Uncharacterized protein LOC104600644 isoform X2 n=1 Tax=Nelumbo nucifera TaxID=4432 RepID=A0A1U8A4E9_NELNU|nr:PREDICTED: uncharacterized protein LOC104600644 isoform X2 [Nelumbo nucifera]